MEEKGENNVIEESVAFLVVLLRTILGLSQFLTPLLLQLETPTFIFLIFQFLMYTLLNKKKKNREHCFKTFKSARMQITEIR